MIGRRTYCYDSSQNLAGLRLIMTIGMESLQRFCMCLSARLPFNTRVHACAFEDTYDKYDKMIIVEHGVEDAQCPQHGLKYIVRGCLSLGTT
jgi:hypothetical protein